MRERDASFHTDKLELFGIIEAGSVVGEKNFKRSTCIDDDPQVCFVPSFG